MKRMIAACLVMVICACSTAILWHHEPAIAQETPSTQIILDHRNAPMSLEEIALMINQYPDSLSE